MKIGIIGPPRSGKKTLFELITKQKPSGKDLASGKAVEGIADISDPRFDNLAEIYLPKKTVRARINVTLIPKFERGLDIEDVDALLYVVRAFRNDAVYHAGGSVDPKRDIDNFNSELLLNDMLFIEKRLERIEKDAQKGSKEASLKEKELLVKFRTALEKEQPLRLVEISRDEKRIIASYPLVTLKQMIVALNVSEDELKNPALIEKFKKDYAPLKIFFMQVSAKVESEIAAMESEAERRAFMNELGIAEPAIDILKRACITALDLISFFTVGADEVRQWLIKSGSSAPEAAGAIHTDLEKGFIRAEVMKYEDLNSLGSEEKVKEAGKFYVKGRDYIVEDGDILSIRFNV